MVTGYEHGRVEVEPKCAQINVSASGQRLSRAVRESHERFGGNTDNTITFWGQRIDRSSAFSYCGDGLVPMMELGLGEDNKARS